MRADSVALFGSTRGESSGETASRAAPAISRSWMSACDRVELRLVGVAVLDELGAVVDQRILLAPGSISSLVR